MDPRQVVIHNLTSQTSSGVAPLAAWDEEGRSVWETSLWKVPSVISTDQTPPSCHADLVLADIDTLWAGHRSPQKGDLALTEILPSTHPILHSEFVEWTNVSNDTLDWKGCAWKPGACLVQSTHSLAHFQVWMGASWSPGDEVLLWEVLPGLSLTNDDGEVTLEDEWGNLLVSAEYSLCGHTDANGPSEGRSMECLPATFNPENPGSKAWQPAWRTSISQEGMSPGLATSWELSDAGTVDVNQTSWGVHEGAWVMTVPHHAPASWWAKDMWNPATEWVPFWHRGALMVRADHGPSVTQMGPVHLLGLNCHFLGLPGTTPLTPLAVQNGTRCFWTPSTDMLRFWNGKRQKHRFGLVTCIGAQIQIPTHRTLCQSVRSIGFWSPTLTLALPHVQIG